VWGFFFLRGEESNAYRPLLFFLQYLVKVGEEVKDIDVLKGLLRKLARHYSLLSEDAGIFEEESADCVYAQASDDLKLLIDVIDGKITIRDFEEKIGAYYGHYGY
jgi:hypothetical protein